MGLTPPVHNVPWFAITDPDEKRLQAIARGLRDAGFLAPCTRYAAATDEPVVRITLSAAHELGHVTALAEALRTLV